MERKRVRGRFEGVANIVRFNWPFYVAAVLLAGVSLGAGQFLVPLGKWIVVSLVAAAALGVAASLLVSFLVYDRSDLYQLPWLDRLDSQSIHQIVNIHAGFDETSGLLRERFPDADLQAWDFFDPQRHTEASILRARKTYPPDSRSIAIATGELPMNDGHADCICVFMAAHEIRDQDERELFFRELGRILRPGGRIFVTEHLRDLPNSLAYSVGVLHFHSRRTWLQAFEQANLHLVEEIKVTPFVSTFVVETKGRNSQLASRQLHERKSQADGGRGNLPEDC